MNNAAAIAAAFGGGLPPGISGTNDRCTLLASSLNPDVSSLSYRHYYSRSLFLMVIFMLMPSDDRRGQAV